MSWLSTIATGLFVSSSAFALRVLIQRHQNHSSERKSDREKLLRELYMTELQVHHISRITGDLQYLRENNDAIIRIAKQNGIDYKIGCIPKKVREDFERLLVQGRGNG